MVKLTVRMILLACAVASSGAALEALGLVLGVALHLAREILGVLLRALGGVLRVAAGTLGRTLRLFGQLCRLPLFARDALHICGIYTHFNCAFGDAALTNREFDAFCAAVARLRAAGKDVGTVHCCNSAAFLRFGRMKLDGVRLGSALLGRMPFPTELQPVGYVQTRVDALHTVPTGHSTGYSALWTAKRQTTLAILPVGWFHGFNVSCQPDRSRRCDGLRAALSGLKDMLRPRRLTVEINGVPCPIVGAIGMLHCAADVTDLPCAPGDPVVMQLNPLHRNELPVVFTD